MAAVGIFDPLLINAAWFDSSAQAGGWFDESLLGAGGDSPDVTLALTGHSLGVAAGSLTGDATTAITGQGVVASRGAVTQATATALTGRAATVAAGSVSGASSLSLAGGSLALAAGSVAVAADDVTLALTGFGMSAAAGSVAVDAPAVIGRTKSRHRWRRFIYPDELEAPKPSEADEPLPSLAAALSLIVETKAALDAIHAERALAVEHKAKALAIDGITRQIADAQARYDAALVAEEYAVWRLQDEDELFLLAA